MLDGERRAWTRSSLAYATLGLGKLPSVMRGRCSRKVENSHQNMYVLQVSRRCSGADVRCKLWMFIGLMASLVAAHLLERSGRAETVAVSWEQPAGQALEAYATCRGFGANEIRLALYFCRFNQLANLVIWTGHMLVARPSSCVHVSLQNVRDLTRRTHLKCCIAMSRM
jgi:hypothetical protein